jgi:hypothetical protein
VGGPHHHGVPGEPSVRVSERVRAVVGGTPDGGMPEILDVLRCALQPLARLSGPTRQRGERRGAPRKPKKAALRGELAARLPATSPVRHRARVAAAVIYAAGLSPTLAAEVQAMRRTLGRR